MLQNLSRRGVRWGRSFPGLSVFVVLIAALYASKVSAEFNSDGLPLPMSFEATSQVTLLFSSWEAVTASQYAVCCLCCIVFGFISIALKVLRRFSDVRLLMAENQGKQKLISGSFPIYHNAIRGFVAFLNYAWDYMLMLVAMTFNAGIFISLLSGIGMGFLLIGHLLDYAPNPHNVASICECTPEASCGCHKGQPCTCCKATKFVDTVGDTQVTNCGALSPQPGACLSVTCCGKPQCGI